MYSVSSIFSRSLLVLVSVTTLGLRVSPVTAVPVPYDQPPAIRSNRVPILLTFRIDPNEPTSTSSSSSTSAISHGTSSFTSIPASRTKFSATDNNPLLSNLYTLELWISPRRSFKVDNWTNVADIELYRQAARVGYWCPPDASADDQHLIFKTLTSRTIEGVSRYETINNAISYLKGETNLAYPTTSSFCTAVPEDPWTRIYLAQTDSEEYRRRYNEDPANWSMHLHFTNRQELLKPDVPSFPAPSGSSAAGLDLSRKRPADSMANADVAGGGTRPNKMHADEHCAIEGGGTNARAYYRRTCTGREHSGFELCSWLSTIG
ncbi:hypothetical protein F5878DRAFT_688674 [Lentinula raphanica]|uniref:Uncharacterized protein n=1 Tax=Lentinula raphanica TaxID=153919 RepID=A0AA38P5A4_9AGAR|nr:hypothetical protein F5878DRAFT_688674 [Lentinula raphanica]